MKQRTANREKGTAWFVLVLAVVGLGCVVCGARRTQAEQIQFGDNTAVTQKKQHVSLVTDAVETGVGSAQVVELRFRVDAGFHINSHAPKDELLIPTVLTLDEGAGVKVLASEYPAGSAFTIGSGSASETLDVYQGEFSVRLRITAPRGDSTWTGTLRYQACDNAACFPPRTLPLRIAIHAK